MENSKAMNSINIALQTAIVTLYESMIKNGRKDLLRSWGQAYEHLQLLKSGITI